MTLTYGKGDYAPGSWWFEIRYSGGRTFCQNRNPFKLLRAFVYAVSSTRRYERTGFYTRAAARRGE